MEWMFPLWLRFWGQYSLLLQCEILEKLVTYIQALIRIFGEKNSCFLRVYSWNIMHWKFFSKSKTKFITAQDFCFSWENEWISSDQLLFDFAIYFISLFWHFNNEFITSIWAIAHMLEIINESLFLWFLKQVLFYFYLNNFLEIF